MAEHCLGDLLDASAADQVLIQCFQTAAFMRFIICDHGGQLFPPVVVQNIPVADRKKNLIKAKIIKSAEDLSGGCACGQSGAGLGKALREISEL